MSTRPKLERLSRLVQDLRAAASSASAGKFRRGDFKSLRGRLLHVLECAPGRLNRNIMPQLIAAADAEERPRMTSEFRDELLMLMDLIQVAQWRGVALPRHHYG